MDIISKFYHFNENKLKNLLRKTFKDEYWLKVFLKDSHHGFIHGNQVRLACLKLIGKLTPGEKEKLLQAGKKICKINSHQYAVSAVEIAAIFHDCGRFNEGGQVVAEEQKYHHILSAKRAKIFCDDTSLNIIVPDVEEAILGHDFQSYELTPDLSPPKTIIGKIVQSSDQMGWFHPDSISRTLDFNKALGISFYNPEVTLKERLRWTPGIEARDALTVMLSQLFGPTDIKRFGIEFAAKKVEIYKIGLKNNIIKIAEKHNLKNEVETLIKDFQKIFS
ncbi:MAG: HD domain-containing protein [Candidatus Omnitrophota bacterium]|nr:HD domain-containing protein [Candidatus Omnitrophota bacterium]